MSGNIDGQIKLRNIPSSSPNFYREKAPTKSTKPLYYIRELIPAQIYAKKLSFGDIGLADDGCTILAEILTNWGSDQELQKVYSQTKSQQAKDSLKKGPEIQQIDLRGNRITSFGLMDLIPALKYVPGLTYLALNWNDLENSNQNGLD